MTHFYDRAAAGRSLGTLLAGYRGREDVLVLGLPRGGVPVAAEVARTLRAPLDVMIVRKLGAPGQPELAVGALASGGVIVINENLVSSSQDSSTLAVAAVIARERAELKRREALYRNDRLPLEVSGRTIILVDDGAATGASMGAAIRATRKLGAKRIVVALPVASADALFMLRTEADQIACILTPAVFRSVGEWYQHFDQTSDTEVSTLLARARACEHGRRASLGGSSEPVRD
jgi:putative phosphoribosyl transferase